MDKRQKTPKPGDNGEADFPAIAITFPRPLRKPIVLYALCFIAAAILLRDQINPDAISYLRNAQYLAEGRLADSVSGYWSPLLSWSIAPLLLMGVDSLFAAKIVLGIWGAMMIVACYCLMKRIRPRREFGIAQSFVLMLLAICSVHWATYVITPDLPLAVLLIFYCSAVLSPDILRNRSRAMVCGLIGGFAYLSKSYGLPFFLAHFTIVIVLYWYMHRERYTARQLGRTLCTGVAAFFIIAGPWIAVLSWKHSRPTFSTVARVAHTVIGPRDKPRMHPLGGLHAVAPGRLHVWETPESLPYNHWSPLESGSYLAHQIQYTFRTCLRVLRDIGSFDLFYLSLPALLLTPLAITRRKTRDVHLALWYLVTVGIYALGFTLVYYANRYIMAFLWPVIFIYVSTFVIERLRLPKRNAAIITALVLISFGMYALSCCQATWAMCRNDHTHYRRLSQAIQTDCAEGVFAYAGQRHEGLYVAYHLDKPFVGWLWAALDESVSEVEGALAEQNVGTFFVSSQWKLAKEFQRQTSWRLQRTVPCGPISYHLYVAPNRETGEMAQAAVRGS